METLHIFDVYVTTVAGNTAGLPCHILAKFLSEI